MSNKDQNVVRVLLSRFSEKSPIRPGDTIDLDANTGAVATGLMITYIIVLIQFKQSETG